MNSDDQTRWSVSDGSFKLDSLAILGYSCATRYLLSSISMEGARSVLVVDDDAIVLRILADQIARAGFVVTSVGNIVEARQHLNKTSFGVVVADQSMPELSGIDFLRECARVQPLASRVLVTGNLGLPEIDQALREGEISRLLIKPWTRFDLVSLFEQAYERHQLLCEREALRAETAILRNQAANLTGQATVGAQSFASNLESTKEKSLTETSGPGSEQEDVVRGSHWAALGEMAGRMAHEFNNALIPILGYIELLLERDQLLEDRGKARHYLRLVLTAAKDATRVADRLREFYRKAERSGAAKSVEPKPAVFHPFFQEVAQPVSRSGQKVGRALKVLIVDDERTSRDLVVLLLKKDHHETTAASSGLEALQLFCQGSYDLLVTDQGMPGMTGAALVDAVRKAGNLRPIIMITGLGDIMKSSGTTPAGVDVIMNKPVTAEALRSALVQLFPEDVVEAE
ncbi:MAG TPA: response regulator [Chthoniobacterales bacterium]|nr:response regulator [Chthoniobacterales bacterium]